MLRAENPMHREEQDRTTGRSGCDPLSEQSSIHDVSHAGGRMGRGEEQRQSFMLSTGADVVVIRRGQEAPPAAVLPSTECQSPHSRPLGASAVEAGSLERKTAGTEATPSLCSGGGGGDGGGGENGGGGACSDGGDRGGVGEEQMQKLLHTPEQRSDLSAILSYGAVILGPNDCGESRKG